MNEGEIRNRITRLRWEADAMEAQMKIDSLAKMGFRSWDGDRSDLKDGDFIIKADNDYKFGVIPSVQMKDWTWYNMTMWIHPKDLKPGDLKRIKAKMMYPDLGYLKKWLGEEFEGDWRYSL